MLTSDHCRVAEDILADCIHDLRQPLGTIETSVFMLHRLIGNGGGAAPGHLHTIERQIEQAVRTLEEALVEMRRLHVEH